MSLIPYSQLPRYLLAEGVALAMGLTSITLASHQTTDDFWLVALSIGSASLGYYATIYLYMLRECWTRQAKVGRGGRRHMVSSTFFALLLTFGGAELLDSLLVSPALLYLCLYALPNPQSAVMISELLSISIFYAIVFVIAKPFKHHRIDRSA